MRKPVIVGDRLYLRPLEKIDAEAMARGAASEGKR